ncbi:uncharacterized protein LOC128189726 [Crassostrea angulata]|uniref:uncharacterized protein LOC128189726 n=1 Tax=Magallana angulata TaxID=2784310 RepID=UPI0022B0D78A|nr:uncharacterized protein LOC128189726 [Crassostrea angulata]
MNMKPSLQQNILLWTLYISFVSVISSNSGCRRVPDLPCCYNEFQDPVTNLCKVCDSGSIGWNCQEKCVAGYYGDLCRQPCFCLAKDCDPVIGCPRTGSTVKAVMDTSTKHYGERLKDPQRTIGIREQQFFSLRYTENRRSNTLELINTTRKRENRITQTITPRFSSDTSTPRQVSIFVTKSTQSRVSYQTRYIKERISTKVTNLRQTTVQGKLQLIRTSPFYATGRQELDLPIRSIWPLLTLVVVALFLLVLGLVIIIILIAWYVLKGSRKDKLPKGIKLFPYRSSMAYNQMRTTLDRGYSSLRRFDPRTANGRRSGYMTTNSLEMAATSTV